MPWILLFLDVLPRAVAAIWQAVLGSQQKRDSQGKEQKRKSVLWWHYWAMDWPDVGLCPAVNSGYGWRYMSCFWADSSQGSSIVCSWKHPSSMCCQSVTHIPKQECTRFSEKYGELLIYGLHSDHENWFKKNVFNIWADNEETLDLHLVGLEGYFSAGFYFIALHLPFHQTRFCPLSPLPRILVNGN